MDMFPLEIHENQPVNHIASFLKTLAFNDRIPEKTHSNDLFSSFEELYSAQSSNPQPPRESSTEPMVEDLPEPTQVARDSEGDKDSGCRVIVVPDSDEVKSIAEDGGDCEEVEVGMVGSKCEVM
ncbi:hypothetical protein LguiB_009551 [Lonicera macranthoides]